ncbi:MAG: RNA-binding cell elongation regulator Jag/EloR [Treponema sp.]
MIYEFEGKTEREAIDKAIQELGLQSDQFDVEIIEIQKNSFFKKGYAKIRIHVDDEEGETSSGKQDIQSSGGGEKLDSAKEQLLLVFIAGLVERMGYAVQSEIAAYEDRKVIIRLQSEDSAILIGKKGKNLDAIQLIANVYAGKIGIQQRIMIDCENYRLRREESLIRLAYTTADQVVMSKKSVLLEPMNPYERRLIHSTLSDIHDVDTKSEGEGLYKQVRVLYKGR